MSLKRTLSGASTIISNVQRHMPSYQNKEEEPKSRLKFHREQKQKNASEQVRFSHG